jgi:cytochrome c peroxidase
MKIDNRALAVCLVAAALMPVACTSSSADEPTAEAQSALEGRARAGKHFFDNALPGTNGRSCATCHSESTHTALLPSEVVARFAAHPNDPLFNRIDADDPDAATPTYAHVKAGLIRVTLPLADNLDLIDDSGNVVTNAARTISVWRSVPSIANTSYTAPYLWDGRAATLEEQALGALRSHSQIAHDPPAPVLGLIADFERTVFTSAAAEEIGEAIAYGEAPPNVEKHFPPGSNEALGQALFQKTCAVCHGGPRGNELTNKAVHDRLFPVIKADGTVDVTFLPDGTQVPVNVHHDLDDHKALNIGMAFGTYLTQIGALPDTLGVDFPHYRVRFYTDASRTQVLADLPPPPPANGPIGLPQAFSVDPGRAIVTGDINDWEAIDIPQLRGIRHTAPYFHTNLAPDLHAVVDIYSRFVLSAFPELGFPLANPPEGPGLPPESLTPAQKTQLVAYLNTL